MAKDRPTTADVPHGAEEFAAVGERWGKHLARSEPRARVVAYRKGLRSDVERKNGWQRAAYAGDDHPYGVQHLRGRADGDADAVRDDLRAYVREHGADPEGVLLVDETGFLKKRIKSAGVQRPYAGTAGRIENGPIGVRLAFAGRPGRTFLDRALYLPEAWAKDTRRRKEAGIPQAVRFATKPALALRMIERAWDGGVKAAWVTGDEVYGSDGQVRPALEQRRQAYGRAVRSDQAVCVGFPQQRVKALTAVLPQGAWQRRSAGDGTKGPRWYDGACVRINGPEPEAFTRWLLVRRRTSDPDDLAYYRCGGPSETPWEKWVAVAGTRWAIAECMEAAKGEVGLAHYAVRSWTGWYRPITLALFAHALRAVIRSRAVASPRPKKGGGRRQRRGSR